MEIGNGEKESGSNTGLGGVDNPGFLSVDNADFNSHTYVYDTRRSLSGMTVDALPKESFYQDIKNLHDPANRPTMEELKMGQLAGLDRTPAVDDVEKNEEEQSKGKVVRFGWIEGVFMRCLLNIWGVMLFLRLTWVVGQGGLIQGLGVIALGNLVTVITTLSMSAVSTNGQIRGGGIYYMISRSLGPEFGGAIGIMFTLANSIAVSMYIIGFCQSLLDMCKQYFELEHLIFSDTTNDVRIIGAISLVAVLALAIVGMEWVTRVQMILLFLLIGSQIDFVVGSFLPTKEDAAYGFVGYNGTLFVDNLSPTYHDYKDPGNPPSFFSVFGVFFPAVTGIVAGANLSGDLKDPGVAIPKGTLLAIIVTFITYIGYGTIITGVMHTEASGNQTEYENWINGVEGALYFNNCSGRPADDFCQYGSSNDQQAMERISYTGYLIYAGCFAATLSSAIASLVGAPRVLQALAKDKLYPFIHIFAPGFGANNDPIRGYFLVFIISMGCILIAELDAVSTLLSNFFVAAYALINFSVFHASITKSPGWRPSFKYYNQWVSLFGTFLCFVVMFLMDWKTALVTFMVIIALYLYISYRKPEANWGSSTQAQQFVTTLKSIQSLNDTPEHVKNYRPKVLVFTGLPAHRPPLVDFANLITKKLSLLMCAHVNIGDAPFKNIELLRNTVQMWFRDHKIKSFYSLTQNKNFEEGAIACMNLAGIGKMRPNMVLFGYKGDWLEDPKGLDEYISVLHHAFDLHLGVGILRLESGCDFSKVIGEEEQQQHEIELDEENEDEKNGKQGKSLELQQKKVRTRKVSTAVYTGIDGNPLPKNTVQDITQFQIKKRKGNIDVWWLYDDGGLTLLLPYILTTRAQFAECQLRVFALANRKDELDRETRNMAALLAKFRIDYSDVTVIPDVTKKALDPTKEEFKKILDEIKPPLEESEIISQKEKTNRHLRLTELLREHSKRSEMIIMTLSIPRRGTAVAQLYMSWLEMMTKNMPPFLLIRGNQSSVLTFYS
ncbi:solute carrier family 12 member 2 isoform X2 [Lepeophtheirus salmonis]|uniref:Uncharacterized protein n=1 Tax=Lepeophtheirus salmonis TaxID=72036 RepID=A0A0K2T810_LEPSM|nr:solute carrier family 12 member 2-like isoform X2 [Lepeophtheirus salmonis]